VILSLNFTQLSAEVSQMQDTRSMVKALYIYTFATLVEWPPNRRSGDFVIGVYGYGGLDVYDELKDRYSEKYIGSQEIVIENYRNKSDINDKSHILFVASEKSTEIGALSKKMQQNNTLIVAESSGALNAGACVNFIVVGNQQKYEINKRNAEKHDLVIAEKLGKLAAKVIE
jgi:hypothetical protein